MDFNHLRTLLILAVVALLSGCATYIEHRMLQRMPVPDIDGFEQEKLDTFSIENREFCLPEVVGCTRYLFVAAKDEETNDKLTLSYDLNINGEMIKRKLELTREDVAFRERGTVLLAHGYGGEKTMWMFHILYLRFLGFNVIVPDLQGHGESSIDQPSFGYHDAEMFSALIDALPARERPGPLIVGGVSMGGLTSVRLATMRDDVAGMLLIAPMAQFDDATVSLISMMMPGLDRLLPNSSIRSAVAGALDANNIPANGANVMTYLPTVKVPTLLFASDIDPIAPYNTYQTIAEQNKEIEVVPVLKRHHFLMTMLDKESHETMFPWLDGFQ